GYAARDPLRRVIGDGAAPLAVRAEAALALGELTDHRAISMLVSLLDEPRYRRRAGVMLGRLRDPRGAPALVEALQEIAAHPDETGGDRWSRQVALRPGAIHYVGIDGDGPDVAPRIAAARDLWPRAPAALGLGPLLR